MKTRLCGLAIAALLVVPFAAYSADPISVPKDATEALAKYDFSTPQAALKSVWKMEADFDIFAMLAYERITRGPKAKLKLASLEVVREAQFEGKKILFVKYKDWNDDDKVNERKDVITMVKDAESGFYVRRYVGSYEISQKNKELAEEMDKWTRRDDLKSTTKYEDKKIEYKKEEPMKVDVKKEEPRKVDEKKFDEKKDK